MVKTAAQHSGSRLQSLISLPPLMLPTAALHIANRLPWINGKCLWLGRWKLSGRAVELPWHSSSWGSTPSHGPQKSGLGRGAQQHEPLCLSCPLGISIKNDMSCLCCRYFQAPVNSSEHQASDKGSPTRSLRVQVELGCHRTSDWGD